MHRNARKLRENKLTHNNKNNYYTFNAKPIKS